MVVRTGATSRSMKVPNLPVWLLAAVLLVVGGYAVSVLPLAEWAQALSSWFEALGAAGFLASAGAYVVAAVLLIPVWPLSITAGVVFGTLGCHPGAGLSHTRGSRICDQSPFCTRQYPGLVSPTAALPRC